MNKRKYAADSRIYLVDKGGMEDAKKEAVATAGGAAAFISSNDVLTSWFFQNCGCRHRMMAINFRGRLEGHDERHAEIYENVVFYRTDDSASPALIRESLSGRPFRRRITARSPMPGFFAMAASSNAICSNWASFAKPCDLLQSHCGCEEEVQIPLYDVTSLLPCTLAICLVFCAGPRGLAVFVAGSPDKLAGLEKKVPFLNQEEPLN
mmetsp:Transcript_52376/g.111295  ORF Transcript_52376/g.111295 Transcript_52376/m.111295 type:complete len:208 (+) Transcript_52376:396-1019(+)